MCSSKKGISITNCIASRCNTRRRSPLNLHVVVGRKVEREYRRAGFVGHVHHPRAAIPDGMAVVFDHLANGCNGLIAGLGNTRKLDALMIGKVFAGSDVEKVARHMALPLLRREHTYLSGADAWFVVGHVRRTEFVAFT